MKNLLHPMTLLAILIVGATFPSAQTFAQAGSHPKGWSVPTSPTDPAIANEAPDGEAKNAEYSFQINGGSISTFPIPAISRLTVVYTAAKDGGLVLRLTDTHGLLVAAPIPARVTAGEARQFSFEVGGLANGTYVLRAQQDGLNLARRVLVAH
ncbi:MAG: hypothetical protein ABI432_12930 [Flavobacteriales bacterium]